MIVKLASITNYGGPHHGRINNPMVGQAKLQNKTTTIIDGPTISQPIGR